MTIHHAAATGFARAADAYERGRPGYPDAAIDWLVAQLPGRDVVDLAAGTGKLTRALVARGCDVVAVEPVAEMRALIAPPARVLDGTAEAIPLTDGSADAVTVAQAFHWFDADLALEEIRRVLRPGGVLALVWNRRLMEDRVNQRLEALMDPHRGDAPTHRAGHWADSVASTRLFAAPSIEVFANEQAMTADGLADRIGSVSFVAALDEAPRTALLAQVRALAADGAVTVRYNTEIQLAVAL